MQGENDALLIKQEITDEIASDTETEEDIDNQEREKEMATVT